MCMCVYKGRATKPATVGEGAVCARKEAERTGGGCGEAGQPGGDAPHSHSGCGGG